MGLKRFAAWLVGCLCLAGVASADTRVEVLCRVDFNDFRFGFCSGPQPCPWVDVRPGQNLLVSFVVADDAYIATTFPCPNPAFVPQTTGYLIRNGSLNVRVGNVPLQGLVFPATDPLLSQPALRLDYQNCAVDVLSLTGGTLMTRAGKCCYPNGACTYVPQGSCAGSWTQTGACTPSNTCPQPVGECCAPDTSCTVVLASACPADSVWTAGGTCQAGACPSVPGACCDPATGSCAITTQANCTATWSQGSACDGAICPQLAPGFDYALQELTVRAPTGMFTSGQILQNRRFYPATIFAPDRYVSFFFSFAGPGGLQEYALGAYPSAMNISDVATPTGSCCPGDGTCLISTQAICPAGGTWTAAGTCAANACPTAAGACCLSDGSCQFLTPAACGAIVNAVYTTNNSVCTTAGVCPRTGGCCAGGACTVVIQSACNAVSGFWMGGGTTCLNSPQFAANLTTTAGACCDSITGQCVIVFQGSCNIGPWLANTTCESLPCTVPVGACCNNGSGACTLVESAFCTRNGGTFVGGTVCDITACPGTGACCNSVSGACTVVFESACAGTWVSGGTCNNPCPGAGSCCNSTTGFCSVVLSTSCSSGTFTPGALCSVPCAGVGTQVPQPVFNGPAVAPLSSPVVVTGPGTVQSIDVWVNLSTTRVNDARLSLVAPNGQTLPLLVRVGSKPPFCTTTPVGGSSGQLGGLGYSVVSGTVIFQDSAPTDIYTGIATGAAAGGGRFKAASCGGTVVSLNAPAPAGFGGLNIAGTWTLVAADESANSTITISSWGVSFNGGKPEPCTIGRCQTGPTCTSTTFVQCTGGSWSIGACTPTCTTGTPGACCYQTSCSVVCASQCPAGASFAGSGTTCSASTCLVRCCLADGSCRLTAPTACVGVAGVLGSTCSPNTCTQPGACCGPNGSCSLLLAGACAASGGTAGAAGSACSPNPCLTLPAPINDRCIDVAGAAGGAQPFDILLSNPINGTWNSLTFGAPSTIAGATGDGVNSSCDAQEAGQDVWYRFLAGASGLHTFSLCSTPSAQRWDSTISVWTACGTQVSGLCADDTCVSGSSGVLGHATLQAALTQGVTYLVRVGAYRPVTTAQGSFTLLATAQTDQGACCFSNGNCVLRTAAACATSNGTFLGTATTCVANACVVRTCCRGATCARIPTGQCVTGGQAVGVRVLDAAVTDCLGQGALLTGCCYADFNKSGAKDVADIFAYLSAWFANSSFADVGGDGTGTRDVSDIFQFLSAWFASCN